MIRSFREDKPYDQFLREQLAGDEIDPKNEEMLVAAGFHRLGPLRKNAGNQDAAYNRNEILVEMTNVIGSGMLGVTLGCARCHDHKFDPIRQKDYYRMQAFFAATQHRDIPLASAGAAGRMEEAQRADRGGAEGARRRSSSRSRPGPRRAAATRIGENCKPTCCRPCPCLQTVEDERQVHLRCTCWRAAILAAPGDKVGMRPLGVLLPDGAPKSGRTTRPRPASRSPNGSPTRRIR